MSRKKKADAQVEQETSDRVETGPPPEEGWLPGMAPEKNERVHEAALTYAAHRDGRMKWTKMEVEAHDALLEAMREEGLDAYEYGDLRVTIESKRKCKVKLADHGEGEE